MTCCHEKKKKKKANHSKYTSNYNILKKAQAARKHMISLKV